MIMPDVNVLVAAVRQDDACHEMASEWLAGVTMGSEELGLSILVLGGVVRVVTNPEIWVEPTSPADIAGEFDRLLGRDRVRLVLPAERHWAIFEQLCRDPRVTGNMVSRAQHAAIAIEHDATWVSFDRHFALIPGFTWQLLEST
jgi:toxin-antitoxin system PIN domain toxin